MSCKILRNSEGRMKYKGMSLRGTKQSRTVQIHPVWRAIASYLPLTYSIYVNIGFERWRRLTPATLRWPTLSPASRKEGLKFFLPSLQQSWREGRRAEPRRGESSAPGLRHFHLHSPRILKLAMTWWTCHG
jgi:hypothetical protein